MIHSQTSLCALKHAVHSNDTKSIPDLLRGVIDFSKISPISEAKFVTLTQPLREALVANPLPEVTPSTPEHWAAMDRIGNVFCELSSDQKVLQQLYKRINETCTLLPYIKPTEVEPRGYKNPRWLILAAAVGMGKALVLGNKLMKA